MIAIPLSVESKQDWQTPQWLFDLMHQRFFFALDTAASPDNAKCTRFYAETENGLVQPWAHTTFCNPPWADPKPWCSKAEYEADQYRVRSVLLLPQLGLTAEWYDTYRTSCRTEIIRPRIAYVGAKKSPPGGSMLMVFGDGGEGSMTFWDVSQWRPA